MSEAYKSFSDPSRWSKFAEFYERYAEPLTGSFAEAVLAKLPDLTGCRLLDVATGSGVLAKAAARVGANVTAIDFADDMVACARRHLQTFPGCDAQVMDGQDLKFPDSSFGISASLFGVMMFPDFRRGLSELVRVTEPGGYVAVGVWKDPIGAGPNRILREAMKSVQPVLSFPEPPAGMVALCAPGGMHAELLAAGCHTVEVHQELGEWKAPNIDAAMFQITELLQRCPVPLYEALDDQNRNEVMQTLRSMLSETTQPDGKVVIPAFAHVAIGRC